MSNKDKNLWWEPPKNFNDKYQSKISGLELFYDLVYLAAISQSTSHLAVNKK